MGVYDIFDEAQKSTGAVKTAQGDLKDAFRKRKKAVANVRAANQRATHSNQAREQVEDLQSTRNVQRDLDPNKADLSQAAQALQGLKAKGQQGTGMFSGQYGRQLQGVAEAQTKGTNAVSQYNQELDAARREIADELISLQGEFSRLSQAGKPIPPELTERLTSLQTKEQELNQKELDLEGQGDDAWSRQALDEESLQDLQGKTGGMAVANAQALKDANEALEGFYDKAEQAELAREIANDEVKESAAELNEAVAKSDKAKAKAEAGQKVLQLSQESKKIGEQTASLWNSAINDPDTKKYIDLLWKDQPQMAATIGTYFQTPSGMQAGMGLVVNKLRDALEQSSGANASITGDNTLGKALQPIYDAMIVLQKQYKGTETKRKKATDSYRDAGGTDSLGGKLYDPWK